MLCGPTWTTPITGKRVMRYQNHPVKNQGRLVLSLEGEISDEKEKDRGSQGFPERDGRRVGVKHGQMGRPEHLADIGHVGDQGIGHPFHKRDRIEGPHGAA